MGHVPHSLPDLFPALADGDVVDYVPEPVLGRQSSSPWQCTASTCRATLPSSDQPVSLFNWTSSSMANFGVCVCRNLQMVGTCRPALASVGRKRRAVRALAQRRSLLFRRGGGPRRKNLAQSVRIPMKGKVSLFQPDIRLCG